MTNPRNSESSESRRNQDEYSKSVMKKAEKRAKDLFKKKRESKGVKKED